MKLDPEYQLVQHRNAPLKPPEDNAGWRIHSFYPESVKVEHWLAGQFEGYVMHVLWVKEAE